MLSITFETLVTPAVLQVCILPPLLLNMFQGMVTARALRDVDVVIKQVATIMTA